MKIGINPSSDGPQMVSPDLLYSAHKPDWANRQTILVEPHVAGSGKFRLKNPMVAIGQPNYTGTVANQTLRLLGKDGEVNVAGWIVVGTNVFHADRFSGGAGDQDWPAGTLIDSAGAWNNWSTNPAERKLAPNFIKDGRDTGYPDGLKPGQSGGFDITGGSTMRLPAGSYAVRCGPGGNGKVQFVLRFRDGTRDSVQEVTFADGVPSPSTIEVTSPECVQIAMSLMESRAGSPLYDLKLIVPGYAEEYDAHADDPLFVVFDEQNLGDLRRGGVARFMDMAATNHSKVIDWDASEEEKYRRILDRVNAARVDAWLCAPHQATDAYVESLSAFVEANLDPSLQWYLEHSNEVWNSSFHQNAYARIVGTGEFTPLRVASLASDGTKVLALKPGHGLATGDIVVFANASDPDYNGAYPVTRIDDDRVSYTPSVVPPAGSATARRLSPLIAYKAPEGDADVITSAEWRWTSGWDQSYLEFTTKKPHDQVGDEIILISGCADPNVNGIYRGDVGYSPINPNRFFVYYSLQGRSCPLPAMTEAGEPAPLVAAPGQVMRVMKLAGSPTAPHVMNSVTAYQRWHARRSKQIFEIAHAASSATPGRFQGGILGLWAGSGGNVDIQDYLLEEYGGSVPDEYTIFPAIAPYIFNEDPTGVSDASIAGDLRIIGELTASGGIATVSGPYQRPGRGSSDEHGLSTGDVVNVVNAFQPEYCGPTTITVISPTQFTFPLPPGANPSSPATPYNLYVGISVVPLPAWGREIVAVARDGDTLTLRSPRHGFAVGDDINIGGFAWPMFDGQFTVESVPDPDTFTVNRPGTTFAPPNPDNPYIYARPWAFSHEIVDLLLDSVEKYVDVRFDSSAVKPTSEQALSRGMSPVFYEFATGFAPSPPYYRAEPANLVYQAGNRDPRIRGILAKCFARAYARDVSLILYYGHIYNMSIFGSYSPKEYQQQVEAPKWLAIEDARALYGPPSEAEPTFDVRPKMAETNTQINLSLEGSGTTWGKATTASVEGGTGAALVDFAVIDATHAVLRLDPGSASDVLSIKVDEVSRPVVVYPAPPRSFFLDTSFVRFGETRRVTLTGINTLWDESARFSALGASISDVVIHSRTSATATLSVPTLKPVTIDDGQGTTLTLRTVAEVIVDEGDKGYAESGSWAGYGVGYGGSLRYRTADGPDNTASWSMTAPASGWWEYQVDWLPDTIRSQNAIYVARKNGIEIARHKIDQRQQSIGLAVAGSFDFQPLGGVRLEAGDILQVELHAESSGGLVADACRFVTAGDSPLTPDIIIDDVSPGFKKVGEWTSWGDGYGGGSLYSSDPTARATWTAIAPEAGTYEIYADWNAGASHALEAHYRILRDGVPVESYIVNQQLDARGDTPAGNWRFQKIGSSTFEAGQEMTLEVSSNFGFLKVDAARFVKATPPAGPSSATGFAIEGPSRLTVGIAGAYTIRPEGGALERVTTVALSDGGSGGAWSPTSLEFSPGAKSGQTATYTPAKEGEAILGATPNPALGIPPTRTIMVSATPANIRSFSVNPTSATVRKPTTITLIGTGTSFGGPDQSSPSVSGGEGASIVDFSCQSPTRATATLVPGSTPGTLTIRIGDLAATITVEGSATNPPDPSPTAYVVDEGDPGYSETGTWLSWGEGNGGSLRYHHGRDETRPTATWAVEGLAAGTYDIQASWNGGGSHASEVQYTLRVNGQAVAVFTADHRFASAGGPPAGNLAFGAIGSFVAPAGASASLELAVSGTTDGDVVADAVRFEYKGQSEVPTLEPSPAAVVAGRTATIRLTGNRTAWSEGTRFTVSGIDDAMIVGMVVESPTSATLTIAPGSAGGTLTISDGVAEAMIEVTPAPQASFTLAPASATAGTPLTITATGSNTDFGGPGQDSATVSGGAGAAIVGFSASSPTNATFTLVPGSDAGTLRVTIGQASANITVVPPTAVPHLSPATGYDVVLPASLMVGQVATAVVVLTGGVDLAAPLVVTLAGNDATFGGAVTIPQGSTYGTTTYSPTTSGTHTVTSRHVGGNPGMGVPSPISVVAIKPISGEPGSGPSMEQVQQACAAAIVATPAKVGSIQDKSGFGLSAAERSSIAAEVLAQMVADTGDGGFLRTLTDRIASVNLSLSVASLDAIAAKLADTPVGVKAGGITSASFAPNSAVPLPMTPPSGYGGSSLTAAQVQEACTAAIVATPATVGTVKDKTGYSLASSGLDAIVVEPGINARQALSPILAASAGIISGAGTGVINIKGGNSATTRITAITDNAGNRSSIQLNLPS